MWRGTLAYSNANSRNILIECIVLKKRKKERKKERGNNHTKGQRASSIGNKRQKGEKGGRKCQKKP